MGCFLGGVKPPHSMAAAAHSPTIPTLPRDLRILTIQVAGRARTVDINRLFRG
jgi:hypothetical protein